MALQSLVNQLHVHGIEILVQNYRELHGIEIFVIDLSGISRTADIGNFVQIYREFSRSKQCTVYQRIEREENWRFMTILGR